MDFRRLVTSRFKLLIVISLLTVLFLVACVDTKQQDWKRIDSPSLGISIQIPESWAMYFADGVLYLGSSQAALDRKMYADEAGVSIAPAILEDLDGADEPITVVENFMLRFNHAANSLEVTSETRQRTIQGQPAATIGFEGDIGDQKGIFTFTAIVQGERAIVIFTVDGSTDGRFETILDQIVTSVIMRAP